MPHYVDEDLLIRRYSKTNPAPQESTSQKAVDNLWAALNNSVATTGKLTPYLDTIINETACELFGDTAELMPRYRPPATTKPKNKPLSYSRGRHQVFHQLDHNGNAPDSIDDALLEIDERTMKTSPLNPVKSPTAPPPNHAAPLPPATLPTTEKPRVTFDIEEEIRQHVGLPTQKEQWLQDIEYKQWTDGRRNWQEKVLPYATLPQFCIDWAGYHPAVEA
jgi:hypothetical protein